MRAESARRKGGKAQGPRAPLRRADWAAATALMLMTLAALLSGCAPASVLRAQNAAPDERTPEIVLPDAHAAAALLAMPGDILLLELGDTLPKRIAVQFAAWPFTLPSVLDLRWPVTNYFHVEFVHDVTDRHGLRTRGYSPLPPSYYLDDYRLDPTYTLVRVRDFPAAAALALRRYAQDDYPRTGFCGDYAAWCYDDRIYSWWNRVPRVQRFFVKYWPPEAIHTGDHIAWSPDTMVICRVVRGRSISPDVVDTARLAEQVARALAADHEALRAHAGSVQARLIAAGAMDAAGRVTSPQVRLRVETAP
jgi:hypothetical protein